MTASEQTLVLDWPVGRSGGLLFFILYNLYLTLRVFDFLVSCHGVDFLSAGVFGLRMKIKTSGPRFSDLASSN